ncbi:hypothetical protein COT40_01560 [Candidatus Peregrinibacteria bacterium CG08_land_8_20_14_0_20_41_10]|nr:MAG: hypothetical protein AUJ78_00165 [Candidatus Peregrinibacteria bacterium CG1_02_41_10]PIS32160.1 MAG: hypothetical protein COT40_01560 [Candidatus Peregrinibacteria bacterium CG08_land_8_20_14_0_20_41_10]
MNKNNIQQNDNNAANSTQLYLKIAEIRDDTVVLKNGGHRAVLEVASINFNLKSEEERSAIIYSYQSFLNTLDFPVQILVQSRKLDIDKYLDNLSKLGQKQDNPLLKKQTFEYLEYVRRLIEYSNIMSKKFYMIIPYDRDTSLLSKNIFTQFWEEVNPPDSAAKYQQRLKEFESMRKELSQRVLVVRTALENVGLKNKRLNTQELIELFYNTYNPLTARNQKVNTLENSRLQK